MKESSTSMTNKIGCQNIFRTIFKIMNVIRVVEQTVSDYRIYSVTVGKKWLKWILSLQKRKRDALQCKISFSSKLY